MPGGTALPGRGQHAVGAQRVHRSGAGAAGHRLRRRRAGVSRPVPDLRHVTPWQGRRPDPARLRRDGRGPGAGLLQRDGDGLAMTLIHAVQQMQVPLLALVLLGACAAKMSRVLRARSVLVVLDATSLFPPRLRRPATMAVCFTELCLGAGILATSGRSFHGQADGVRLATALFFLIAMCAMVELRESRPDLGCGCFGELSSKPPGPRSLLRTGLLATSALASIHGGELTLPPAGPTAALRRSRIWRRHAGLVADAVPADMWRELCWWYLVYPGRNGTGECDIVFAVEVRPRRPAIRAAVVPRSNWPAGEPSPEGTSAGPWEAATGGLSPAF